jgi:ribosomal protein L37AE/L43A
MSRKVDAAPAIESSQEAAGKHVANASPNGPERQRHGILRRRRKASARVYRVDVCPACGLRIRDKVAARLGFCDQCHEFTGMCGAGRRVVCPDMMTRTSWHTPCTELGAVAWAINQGQGLSGTMLCATGSGQRMASAAVMRLPHPAAHSDALVVGGLDHQRRPVVPVDVVVDARGRLEHPTGVVVQV